MEITIEFNDGPLEVTIDTAEDEDYKRVLNDLGEFVKEYDPVDPNPTNENGEAQMDEEESEDQDIQQEVEGSENSLVTNTGLSEGELQRIIKLGRMEDEELVEYPEIIGNTDLLGDTGQERLVYGTAVVMTVVEDEHGISKTKTTKVKDALKESGLNTNSWNNINRVDETDMFFNRRGQGSTATIEIRQPGKTAGYESLEKMGSKISEDSKENGKDEEETETQLTLG